MVWVRDNRKDMVLVAPHHVYNNSINTQMDFTAKP